MQPIKLHKKHRKTRKYKAEAALWCWQPNHRLILLAVDLLLSGARRVRGNACGDDDDDDDDDDDKRRISYT